MRRGRREKERDNVQIWIQFIYQWDRKSFLSSFLLCVSFSPSVSLFFPSLPFRCLQTIFILYWHSFSSNIGFSLHIILKPSFQFTIPLPPNFIIISPSLFRVSLFFSLSPSSLFLILSRSLSPMSLSLFHFPITPPFLFLILSIPVIFRRFVFAPQSFFPTLPFS